ncbi:MAG: hypothetical protein ACXVGE_13210 [Blastococcus sp.]
MTAVPHPLATRPARSDRGLQRRRRLRAARTQVGLSVQTRLLPVVSERRRQRLHVCGAANTLTALGVRVRVLGPSIPWPRTRCVVAAGPLGRLGGLAVATVLRGEPVRSATEVPDGATVCPVAVRYRLDGDVDYLPEDDVPTSVAGIAALDGLVVEVHLLPALPPAA